MAVLPVLCGPMCTSRAPSGIGEPAGLIGSVSCHAASGQPGASDRRGRRQPSHAERRPGNAPLEGCRPWMPPLPGRAGSPSLLAGGVGGRVGLDIPKQLIKIAGKTIIEHTSPCSTRTRMVDEIIVMMAPGTPRRGPRDRPRAAATPRSPRSSRAARPATRRPLRALAALGDEECNVLLPRRRAPAAHAADHHRLLRGAASYAAVDVAIPSADTIIEVDDRTTPSRDDPAARARCGAARRRRRFRSSVIRRGLRARRPGPGLRGHRRLHRRAALPAPTCRSRWCAATSGT